MTRLLALICAWGVLFGTAALPAAPQLVCRATGAPMPPVAAFEGRGGPCCDITPVVDADGTVAGWRLIAPGCCDLEVAPGAPHAPAALLGSGSTAALIFWAPAPRFTPPIFVTVAPNLASFSGSGRRHARRRLPRHGRQARGLGLVAAPPGRQRERRAVLLRRHGRMLCARCRVLRRCPLTMIAPPGECATRARRAPCRTRKNTTTP